MALTITRKTRTILLIILGVLVIGGGGFLIWRVTREETVAPEDSEAAAGSVYKSFSDCQKDPAYHKACSGSGTEQKTCHGFFIGCQDGKYQCLECTPPSTETYTLTYSAESGGKISGDTSQEVEEGESGTQVTAKPYSAFEFLKWSDGKTSASRTDTNVQKNISVTAKFTSKKYTVTYNGNGGTCTPTSRSVSTGQTSAKPNCSRTGHTLTGFVKTGGTCGSLNQKTGAITNVTCNITVKATWKKKTYTVTYNANGGSCTPSTRTVDYNGNAARPACSKRGYNLARFVMTVGDHPGFNKETGALWNIKEDITIKALWSKSCGDGTCADNETPLSCPVDCPKECGDGYCSHDETALTCPDDCEANCGDGYCTHDENAQTCSVDCDENCGDGLCTGDENAQNCPADCDSICGDGYCTVGEDSDNCPEDCGEPVVQGEDPVSQGGTVPQTGIFDTILGKISLGFSFIFLGGLVSQYSRINYLFNSMVEKHEFRKEIRSKNRARRKQKQRDLKSKKRRAKLEDRFK